MSAKTVMSKLSRPLKWIWAKKFILIILGLLIGIPLYYFVFKSAPSKVSKEQLAKVGRGDIRTSISASGSLISSNKSDISPRVSGTITKIYFKEGDKVSAGNLLFEMDDTDGLSNLRKVNDSINQSELTQKNTMTNISKLVMKAPFGGQVSDLQIQNGDNVGKNATILTLTDLSTLKVQVPFNSSAMNNINLNQKVTVHISDLMQSVEGHVSYVGNKASPSLNGGQIFYVEIIIHNPGSLIQGMKASAQINSDKGTFLSTDYGTLDYVNKKTLRSDSGGTVLNLNVKEKQFVNSGEMLAQFQNDDLSLSKESASTKLIDLYNQLTDANKQLENYKVFATVEGVITKQELKVGDVVKQGDIVSSISNNINMEFSVSFDELDIEKLQVGQKASVTIDALPDTNSRPLTGTVSKIALEGTPSNGVTTYPVSISVPSNEKLKVGMNASAKIIISEKKDVLKVSVQAVQKMGKRAFVMVKGAGASKTNGEQPNTTTSQAVPQKGNRENTQTTSQSGKQPDITQNTRSSNRTQTQYANNPELATYYKDAVRKVIEVGLSDEDYIEVISGLNEGDEVLLPPVYPSTTGTQANTGGSPFGGMGGGNASRMGGGGSSGGGNSSRATGGGGGNTSTSTQNRNGGTSDH